MAGAEPIAGGASTPAPTSCWPGRTSDAALFAAIPLARGFDPGPVWNAAKIVECGSAAAENRSGQDCLACTFDDEGFILEPLDPALRCTPRSVAAHTLYETADPYRLVQPSGTLDAREARYIALDERRVRVVGGSFEPATEYTAKLEGAAPVGFLSSFWGSTRDPIILSQLDTWIETLTQHIRDRLAGTFGEGYDLRISVYGANGTTGEPTETVPREAVLSFDLLADTQEDASAMARAAYHVALHWPVKEWSGSITTFAHRYSRPVVDRGPVYRFTLNHARRARRGRTHVGLPGQPCRTSDDRLRPPQAGLEQVRRHFRLIRSKDAGPFMLTLDLFFADADVHRRFGIPACSTPAVIAELYRVDSDRGRRLRHGRDLGDEDQLPPADPERRFR